MDITLDQVSFAYANGVQALHEVNLHIPAGQDVALIGENGAGKTTLVKQINGLLKPGQGRVLVGDWDTHEHTVARLAARVGYVFQNPDDQLFARSVRAEVAFGPKNLGVADDDLESRVTEALQQVGLQDQIDQHPYDLQPCQRKLLALAAVLAMNTPVIILDEPTTGQDARGVASIAGIVDRLKSAGRTVITVTHDIDFCAEHFRRVIVMANGDVIGDGPAGDILSRRDVLGQAQVEPPRSCVWPWRSISPARPLQSINFSMPTPAAVAQTRPRRRR